jgi:hypothetical protein
MEKNNFEIKEINDKTKPGKTDKQKESAKLRRQEKRKERQEDPEEDLKFKLKHRSYYAAQSEETKESNKAKRNARRPENVAEYDAQVYASRSEVKVEDYKQNREEAIEKNTEEMRAKIKKVIS